MWSFNGNAPARRRRGIALAASAAAGLLLSSLPSFAAGKAAPKTGKAPARESPYMRFAREHAKLEQKKPQRVKTSSSNPRSGHGPRAGRH
jgi:hypothetical protein